LNPKAQNDLSSSSHLWRFCHDGFAFCFLPIDGASVLSTTGFDGDLIVILSFATIANFLMFLAGWASNNHTEQSAQPEF
jgi:NADH:ubiquinone oxidoreductase subunit H